jgi:signal recognition particle subunit SRP54
MDAEKSTQLSKKMQKGDFDFDDYLVQSQAIKKMGGVLGMMKMMPGFFFLFLFFYFYC